MSSSSDSDLDDNTKKLLASVDTSFISDKMYKEKVPADGASTSKGNAGKLKSNRHLDETEVIFYSDVNVPESMQNYIGKKFSEMVAQQVEFVEIETPSIKESPEKQETDDSCGILLLLKGAPPIDLNKDPLPDLPEMATKPMVIKKRVIEEDTLTEQTKVKRAAIDPELLLSGTEIRHWKRRQKPKVFEYKTKNGIGYLREPVTEWTGLRNKNNWCESKIKDFHEKLGNKRKS